MAIDRNIISWSATEKAFKAKSYIEIFNMLLENYRAIYGAEIDLTVETPFGEELRMEAQQLYDFAKLAENVYYTLDVNNASGAILDNLVSFTSNLIRKTNVQTILTGELKIEDVTGGGNISLINNPDVYVQDEYNILWKVQNINSADTVLEVGATLATAPINEVRLTCATYGENLITNDLVLLLVGGSYYTNSLELDTIIYEQIGSVYETDEQLKLRKNNTLSYNSYNLLDSIRDYILKNIYSIKDVVIYNANGRKTGDSSTDTAGNTLISLYTRKDIVSDVLDPLEEVTIPKHDLLVIVQPQTGIAEQADPLSSFRNNSDDTDPTALSLAIAQVLKDKITPGIATTYALIRDDGAGGFEPITESEGYIESLIDVNVGDQTFSERYNFYVAKKYSPAITVSLIKKNNYDQTTTRARIREAIYNLSTDYTINKNISLDEVLTVVRNCNLDINNPTFTVAGVQIENGNTSYFKVNNGYWLVDKNAVDYDITIVETT